MKPTHDKMPISTFEPGAIYTFSLRGKPLYRASVVKFHGGCWATISIVDTVVESGANLYQPGMTFDIKVAEYEISKA